MEERRADMREIVTKIDAIVTNQALIKSYIEHQFGGKDLVGTPVEGEVTRTLRLLNEKVAIQNGRIGKLELKHAMQVGALTLVTLGLPVIIFLIGKAWK